MYWELERCMLLPRESQALHLVMTSLMSTPLQRERIRLVDTHMSLACVYWMYSTGCLHNFIMCGVCSGEGRTLMPYDIWEGKFQKRVAQWYKALQDCDGSVEKVRFWEIEKKISFKIGIWLHKD